MREPPTKLRPQTDPWSFLPPRAREAVHRMGFAAPTPVQAECLPPALAGESIAAVAPTGTGKTLIYLLPVWNAASARGHNLILVPTRELGYQVSQMLQALDPEARAGIALCVGGHDIDMQLKSLRSAWHTLIATPGRLLDILGRTAAPLKNIRLLVLDEFDRLIELGFEEQLAAILSQLPPRRQTLLFSATGEDAVLDRLPLGKLRRLHVLLGKTAPLSEQFFFLKSNRKKGDLLLAALGGVKGQAMVFVSNREKANHLNGLLRMRGFSSVALHGDRLQWERAAAYQDFKTGRVRVLVATDLAGRGLDVPEVDLIVNYDLPRSFKDYVHRSGRTARRSRPGTCLSFAGPDDYLPLRSLEKGFGAPLPCHPDYAQRDRWLENAKRVHDTEVKREERSKFIRSEQGLNPTIP